MRALPSWANFLIFIFDLFMYGFTLITISEIIKSSTPGLLLGRRNVWQGAVFRSHNLMVLAF